MVETAKVMQEPGAWHSLDDISAVKFRNIHWRIWLLAQAVCPLVCSMGATDRLQASGVDPFSAAAPGAVQRSHAVVQPILRFWVSLHRGIFLLCSISPQWLS